MMIIAGNVGDYLKMKRISVVDYLIKLDIFVRSQESDDKVENEQSKKKKKIPKENE